MSQACYWPGVESALQKKVCFSHQFLGLNRSQLQGSNWTMWRVNLESVSATLEFEVAKTAPKISALLQMTP